MEPSRVTFLKSTELKAYSAIEHKLQNSIGILALEGSLTITGNEVITKMADLSDDVTADSNLLSIRGIDLGFDLGGELVLPDTQM